VMLGEEISPALLLDNMPIMLYIQYMEDL